MDSGTSPAELRLESAPPATVVDPAARATVDDPGLPECCAAETPAQRWMYACAALLLAVGWFALVHIYWTAGNEGTDQNAYLVGGRMLADHFSTRLTPTDPLEYVGRAWIETPWQTYYPKYPLGLPMLFAGLLRVGQTPLGRALAFEFTALIWGLLPAAIFIFLRSLPVYAAGPARWHRAASGVFNFACLALALIASLIALRLAQGPFDRLPIPGPSAGVVLCYLLCPLCALAALLATFLLTRVITGSFTAIAAMLALACSPVTLDAANNANSHAPSLACAAWGMFLLIRWWQRGGFLRAAITGLLLGFAVMIRYTEALLLMPIVITVIFRAPWRSKPSMKQSLVLLGAWLLPILFLLGFNLRAFGALTAYDLTHESTEFAWKYFRDNWEITLRQINEAALFFILPAALVGLVALLATRWRMAVILAAWIVPSSILYCAYYMARDDWPGNYLRFYLSVFPALLMAAFYLAGPVVRAGIDELKPGSLRARRLAGLSPILLLLCSAAIGLHTAIPDLNDQYNAHLHVTIAGEKLANIGAAPGSIIFCDDPVMLKHLQFAGAYRMYNLNQFTTDFIQAGAPQHLVAGQPQAYQSLRSIRLYDLFGKFTPARLLQEQSKIVNNALQSHRPVFLVIARRETNQIQDRFFPPDRFQLIERAAWQAPPLTLPRYGTAAQRARTVPPPIWEQPSANREPITSDAPVQPDWVILEVLPMQPATRPQRQSNPVQLPLNSHSAPAGAYATASPARTSWRCGADSLPQTWGPVVAAQSEAACRRW